MEGLRAWFAFWDYACAFPSVGHLWLFCLLDAYGFPAGFVALVKGMYHCCFAYSTHGSALLMLWIVRAGVLQGCPLSGLLFSIAMDPFALALDKLQSSCNLVRNLRDKGHSVAAVVRLFADDVGAAIGDLRLLKHFAFIFDYAERLACLVIKPRKCVLVPLFDCDIDRVEKQARNWLRKNIPKWAEFKIQRAATYLGFALGPAAGESQVLKTEAKWWLRGCCMSKVENALAPTVVAYNVYAASVWSFKAQLMHLPDHIFEKEHRLHHMLMKIPFNAYGADGPCSLSFFGLPEFRSLRVMNMAALARTANVTITNWRSWYKLLVSTAEACLSPIEVLQRKFSPSFWDSPPFVCNLRLYDIENPLAWQHVASVSSVDAAPGLASTFPVLEKSWKKHEHACDDNVPKLLEACKVRPKCQRHIFRTLHPCIVRQNWKELIVTRILAFCMRHGVESNIESELSSFPWDEWMAALLKIAPFVRSLILRSIFNSWITSHRIPVGKTKIHCLFCGRHGLDSLSHYLCCHALWDVIQKVSGIQLGKSLLSRLGFDVDLRRLYVAGFAPFLYHHVKHKPADSTRTYFHWRAYLATVKPKIQFFSQPFECLPSFSCGNQVPVSPPCPDVYDGSDAAAAATADAPVSSDYLSTSGSAPPVASLASLESDAGHNDHRDLGPYGDHNFNCVFENLDFETENWERLFFEAMGFDASLA